ncbi:MAG: cupin [Cyanobacteria bacterium P01_A01_bin.105]
MTDNNWLIDNDGQSHRFEHSPLTEPEQPYRLYRFLTDLEDILLDELDDHQRLQRIIPLVRQLLTSAYWLQMEFDQPGAKGWSVRFLYREYGFPLTVQMVAWAPGQQSTIHNHATWGIVALVGGAEKNQLWQRQPSADHPHQIVPTGDLTLAPGDIIGFMPGAIHQVKPLGDEPTVSFNLYGVTDKPNRYQFDPTQKTAKRF